MLEGKFKNKLKEIYSYIRDELSLEAALIDSLLIGAIVYGNYNYKIGLTIFFCVVLIKLFSGNLINSIFNLKLGMEIENQVSYIFFLILNLFICVSLIAIDYSKFEGFLSLIIVRVIYGTENMKIQNNILAKLIEEVYDWGEVSEISRLATKKTIASAKNLITVKEQIKKSVEKEMETEYLRTDLITNISHDLKTPLTSIVTYAEILAKKDEMDTEAKEYIHVLERNSNRLKNLIADLIFASKAGAGDIKVEKSFIDFNELVLQIYGDFDQRLADKNVDFIYADSDTEVLIYTDGNILSRIVQNLMSNAYKYSKPNTKIIAKIKYSTEDIFFSMENTSLEELLLNEKELFTELVKAEKSRTTEGSGLGLYIAKNLSELLGGALSLRTNRDKFKVYLELKRDLD